MPEITSYSSFSDRASALMPQMKLDKDDIAFDALRSMPIPELKEDFTNYEYWHHAVWFHLEFYGLRPIVTHLRMYFPHGLCANYFDNEEQYQLFLRHKLHAYSIVYSKAANVIEKGPLWPKHYAKLNFCPDQLMDVILGMKDSVIPVPSPAYEGYVGPQYLKANSGGNSNNTSNNKSKNKSKNKRK
ncbi:hypothetical protein B0T20DRAFT_484501 [Sordaria brevicollis]|uniref:Uncharacterized protein n=1 Tax=Sordaria brevicollis TaxID=83679 RepID=A0AAE0U2E0_SORBR|nr:hypothetical protein B0T20DRAFT_484501 [Sordaria brevicollis]